MIAEGLPLEIAWKEYRLNLSNQYSELMAVLVYDMVLIQITNEVALDTLKLLTERIKT